MEKIGVVIFDLGRVLTRVVPGDRFSLLMRRIGVPPEEAFSAYWKGPEVVGFMTGSIDARRFHGLVEERFAPGYGFREFGEAWCDIFQPMPGMEDLFGELADRYPVGILSDTDPLHWARIREIHPWLRRASAPTLSFEVGSLKPDAAMYERAAANAGFPVGRCLFIDDVPDNVAGAEKAGMRGLRFTGAEKLRRDLEGLGVLS